MIANTNSISRVYVDTSVVGGLFDAEFQWQTKPFWDAVQQGGLTAMVSSVVEHELEIAPISCTRFLQTSSGGSSGTT